MHHTPNKVFCCLFCRSLLSRLFILTLRRLLLIKYIMSTVCTAGTYGVLWYLILECNGCPPRLTFPFCISHSGVVGVAVVGVWWWWWWWWWCCCCWWWWWLWMMKMMAVDDDDDDNIDGVGVYVHVDYYVEVCVFVFCVFSCVSGSLILVLCTLDYLCAGHQMLLRLSCTRATPRISPPTTSPVWCLRRLVCCCCSSGIP